MGAYYNEHDPFAAAWLRELIKANLIAPGEVDERSIEDVESTDLKGFTQCHFFAGIGVWSYALRNAGWPDDTPVWTGSCPCQGFSSSGKRGGFSDKRHLWPAWCRLIKKCRPHTIFGEQVASKDGLAWLDVVSADLEGKGYALGAADICAAGVGAPHIRQRLFFVADAEDSDRRRTGNANNRRRRIAEAGRPSTVSELAQSDRLESSNRRLQRGGRLGRIEEDAALGELDNALSHRRRTLRHHDGSNERLVLHPASEPRGMVHSTEDRCRDDSHDTGNCRCSHESQPEHEHPDSGHRDSEPTDQLADPNGGGCSVSRQTQSTRRHGDSVDVGRGPTNGFWRDAEWLYCRDGKYRPTKPGTPVLATGVTNRVGKLRGYGNSIVAPVAQAFIEAFMRLQPDLHQGT